MKAIRTAVFAAAALAAAAFAPNWAAKAQNPPQQIGMEGMEAEPTAKAEGEAGLDGWEKVHLDPNGIPPATINARAAIMLARKNGCFRCHAIDTVKTGPAFRSVAQAYKGNLQAGETRETSHLTAGDIFVLNGKVDHHRVLNTEPPNDPAQLKNLIYWIFSLDQ